MTLLGLLSFFQITFIPGFIFIKIFKFKLTSKLQIIIYSFSLSLLINYFLVYFLTLLKFYNPYVIYSILAIEFSYLIYLIIRKRISFNVELEFDLQESRPPLKDLFIALSIIFIFIFFYFFTSNLYDIFRGHDALFSWNRWAIDWYLNDIPYRTNTYPQLIPANWSLTYIIMQNHHVQFFANSIMPLFPLLTSLLFLDLFNRKKNIINIVSLIFYGIIIIAYSSEFIKTGFVDIAVSFFLFLTLYSTENIEDNNVDIKNLILLILSACAAALTKQFGLLALTFSIIWVSWILIKNRKNVTLSDTFKKISILFFVIILTLSWYLFKIIEIKKGSDISAISYLTQGIHEGRSYLQRFIYGMNYLHGGTIFFYFLLFFVILSLFQRKSRWFSIGLTLPIILIWGLFFSYDGRNLIPAFPFIAYSSAYGIAFLFEKIRRKRLLDSRNKEKVQIKSRSLFFKSAIVINSLIVLTGIGILTNKWAGIFLLKLVSYLRNKPIEQNWFNILNIALIIIVLIGFCGIITTMYSIIKQKIPHKIYQFRLRSKYILIILMIILIPVSLVLYLYSDKIIDNQIESQKSLGIPEVNHLLYDYKDQYKIDGKIVTDYYIITAIPGFEGKSKKIFLENENFKILAITPPYTSLLGTIDDNTYGLLISDNYYHNPEFSEEISERLKNGEFTLIFSEQGLNFIKINR